MEDKKQYRVCSSSSRIWIAADQICPPLANQMIIESKTSINRKDLEHAMVIASRANPGSRLVMKGFLGASKWVDSHCHPIIREVDGRYWNGLGSENAPFLKDSFDVRKGPTCEAVIIEGSPQRVAFRSHHAVMDGRGTMTWVEDIFRALRGEEPLGSDYIYVENDLLNLTDSLPSKPLPHRYLSPVGSAAKTESGIVWKRIEVTGSFTKLLPRLMLFLAREAWKHEDGPVRIGIPVDLRPREPGLRSTGNLTNAIYIDVSLEMTVQSLGAEIKRRLAEQIDGQVTWEDRIIRHLPLCVLRSAIRSEIKKKHASNKYRYSAFISNLGQIDTGHFRTAEFEPVNIFAVPASLEFLPISIGIVGYKDTLNVMIAMPRVFAEKGRIESIVHAITADLINEQ